MDNIIECKNLTKTYHGFVALNSINMEIKKGRIVGLLGPNGSGKTTFIKLANGLLTPSDGQLLINGKPVGVNSKKIVSYLPDHNFLTPWRTVKQMIEYFSDFYADFRAERAYEMLKNLNIDFNRKIKTLSKGTQEKVELILVMSRQSFIYLMSRLPALIPLLVIIF